MILQDKRYEIEWKMFLLIALFLILQSTHTYNIWAYSKGNHRMLPNLPLRIESFLIVWMERFENDPLPLRLFSSDIHVYFNNHYKLLLNGFVH